MAKITRSDIKALIGNTTTTYDNTIDDLINFAYGHLDNYIGLDTANDKFKEYRDIQEIDDIKYIYISAVTKDAVLTKVEIDGTAINLTSDISKEDFTRWEIINETYESDDYVRFYAEYTSVNLMAQIKKILTEIILFELYKLPAFTNSIIRKTVMAQGVVSESFIPDEQFYKEIYKKLSALFIKKI